MADKAPDTKMEGEPLDSDAVAAGIIAVAPLSYMGIHVASHVTEDEYRSLVVAIISAVDAYRAGQSI